MGIYSFLHDILTFKFAKQEEELKPEVRSELNEWREDVKHLLDGLYEKSLTEKDSPEKKKLVALLKGPYDNAQKSLLQPSIRVKFDGDIKVILSFFLGDEWKSIQRAFSRRIKRRAKAFVHEVLSMRR